MTAAANVLTDANVGFSFASYWFFLPDIYRFYHRTENVKRLADVKSKKEKVTLIWIETKIKVLM